MKKLILILAGILIYAGWVWAWTGSDPASYVQRIGTGTSSATLDGETITVPSSVFVRAYNLTQGMDYTNLYLIDDTNSDSIIQQSELDNIELLVHREDLNLDIDNVQFGPRYLLGSDKIVEGNSYFLILPSKDLNGDCSVDTSNMAGLTGEGDETHSDSDIRQFYGGILRP